MEPRDFPDWEFEFGVGSVLEPGVGELNVFTVKATRAPPWGDRVLACSTTGPRHAWRNVERVICNIERKRAR